MDLTEYWAKCPFEEGQKVRLVRSEIWGQLTEWSFIGINIGEIAIVEKPTEVAWWVIGRFLQVRFSDGRSAGAFWDMFEACEEPGPNFCQCSSPQVRESMMFSGERFLYCAKCEKEHEWPK